MTDKLCRICFEDNNLNTFCYCKGSSGYMHQKCLEKWLNYNHIFHCEICKYKYNIEYSYSNFKNNIYTLLKKYIKYFIFYIIILYNLIQKLIYKFNFSLLFFLLLIIFLLYKSFYLKWKKIYYINCKIKIK
jgi:E3 ubiquitin-protein ligase DOA10